MLYFRSVTHSIKYYYKWSLKCFCEVIKYCERISHCIHLMSHCWVSYITLKREREREKFFKSGSPTLSISSFTCINIFRLNTCLWGVHSLKSTHRKYVYFPVHDPIVWSIVTLHYYWNNGQFISLDTTITIDRDLQLQRKAFLCSHDLPPFRVFFRMSLKSTYRTFLLLLTVSRLNFIYIS